MNEATQAGKRLAWRAYRAMGTREALARACGVTRWTVYRWMTSGKFGETVRIALTDIVENPDKYSHHRTEER